MTTLYSIAADLFTDIDKARISGLKHHATAGRRQHNISAREHAANITPKSEESELPSLRRGEYERHEARTPTLELLDECLSDIHQIRKRCRKPSDTASEQAGHSWKDECGDKKKGETGLSGRVGGKGSEWSGSAQLRSGGLTARRCGSPETSSGDNSDSSIGHVSSSWGGTTPPKTDSGSSDPCPKVMAPGANPKFPVTVSDEGSNCEGHKDRWWGTWSQVPSADDKDNSTRIKRQNVSARRRATSGTPTAVEFDGTLLRRMPRDLPSALPSTATSKPTTFQDENKRTVVVEKADTDAVAAKIFTDFEREVEKWNAHSHQGTNNLRPRGEDFALHLSAKYLCGRLDPVPSSPFIRQLRREVACRIDLLANESPDSSPSGEPRQAPTSKGPNKRTGRCENNTADASSTNKHHVWALNRCLEHVSDDIGTSSKGCRYEGDSMTKNLVVVSRGHRVGDRHGMAVDPCATLARTGEGAAASGPPCNASETIGPPDYGRWHSRGWPEQVTTPPELGGESSKATANPPRRLGAEILSAGDKKKALLSPAMTVGDRRSRGVRFLLDETSNDKNKRLSTNDGGKKLRADTTMTAIQKGRSRVVNLEGESDAQPDKVQSWTCTMCGKRNEEKQGMCKKCAICGSERCSPNAYGAHFNARGDKTHLPDADARCVGQRETVGDRCKATELGQQIHDETTINNGTGVVERAKSRAQAGALLPRSERQLRGKDAIKREMGSSDFVSFSKMRQRTEGAVKARLGLTGEIKSLLTAIRRCN